MLLIPDEELLTENFCCFGGSDDSAVVGVDAAGLNDAEAVELFDEDLSNDCTHKKAHLENNVTC